MEEGHSVSGAPPTYKELRRLMKDTRVRNVALAAAALIALLAVLARLSAGRVTETGGKKCLELATNL